MMKATTATELLLKNRVAEADNEYNAVMSYVETNPLSPTAQERIYLMLVAFAIILDSEDARFNLRTLQLTGHSLSLDVRAFNWWWLYPVILLTDFIDYFGGDPIALKLMQLKYTTPVSWYLKRGIHE
jgi:hypothetical protein